MASKKKFLTSVNEPKNNAILTVNIDRKFKILLSEEIQNGFDFSDMQSKEAHCLSRFFDKTIGKNWSFVEKKYGRQPDQNDIVNGREIMHFEVTSKGRLHGYELNGEFVIVRIDMNHKYHS